MDTGSCVSVCFEEDLRFNPSNLKLVSMLCQLETYLRRYFDLPVDSNLPDLTQLSMSPTDITVQIVLMNYLYDAYVRLLISGNVPLVSEFEWSGTVSLLWSLERAYKLDPLLYSVSDSISEFSARLDNLRRSANIDILASNCLLTLDECRRLRCNLFSSLSFETETLKESETESMNSVSRVTISTRYPRYHHEDESTMLTHLKTFYDVERDNRLFDHSSHYNDAFVPAYRFCNSRLSELNMSCHIGHTMRENIRGLYNYISDFIGDQRACPCVVIFNLFIRDNYRMYHSKSLRQSSFVSIKRSDGTVVRLSYMIVTNLFPRISSWFKSINNQLVKKTGKTHILHLDAFVRLLLQLLRSKSNSSVEESAKKLDASTLRTASSTWRRNTKKRNQISALNALSKTIAKKTVHRSSCSLTSSSSSSSASLRRRSFRLSLSNLYRVTDDINILVDLFSTAYVSCKHERLKRTYEQLRSNDESATLVRLCLDCGHRV